MQPSQRIGKYVLIRRLGAGGMGEVWLADDPVGRSVALKVLGSGTLAPERALRRFMREAHVLAQLQHPGISRIYSVEEHQGSPVLVMEYEQGIGLDTMLYTGDTAGDGPVTMLLSDDQTDISQLVARLERTTAARPQSDAPAGPSRPIRRVLPLQQTLGIVAKVCDAVQYAHERGVLHRDIKPSNIVIRRDGEPVLLDFGVAKFHDDMGAPALTATGETFGTIEYMSPEQALSSRDVDERTDVYSLGVILYEMVTGVRFFQSSGNVIADARRLEEYSPHRPRHHRKGIDRDLEAVILKATESDRSRRYRSAQQLAADIRRYREGQPVSASPHRFYSRPLRWMKRRRGLAALAGAVLTLAAALGAYVALDHYARWGKWVRVYGCDFTQGSYDPGQFTFVSQMGGESRAWECDTAGLAMAFGDWCWFRTIRVEDNARVVAVVRYGAMPDGLEMVIHGSEESPDVYWHLPAGYSCQVGGYNGTVDFVSINRVAGPPRLLSSSASHVAPDRQIEVLFERKGERVELRVNGRCQALERDLLPLSGRRFGRIGLHCYTTGVRLRRLEVYHLALPRKATPLVAGQALLVGGHAEEAFHQFLRIADDFGRSPLAEEALFGAFLAALEMPRDRREPAADSAAAFLAARFPASRFRRTVHERRMAIRWQDGAFEEIMGLLPQHMERNPSSRIALELCEMSKGLPFPAALGPRLAYWMARTEGVSVLDISRMDANVMAELATPQTRASLRNLRCEDMGLTSLAPLAGMGLQWLSADGNRITDLSPLAGQPLRYLGCRDNEIASLEPVADAPLVWLSAGTNQLTSLPRFRRRTMMELWVPDNRIEDISPLAGLPLRRLFVLNNRIRSLTPLAGMPLEELSIEDNPIADFSPLSGMPLQTLLAGNNAGVLDLAMARRMPLRSLSIDSMPVGSLAPLAGSRLEYFMLASCGVSDISPLAGMPLTMLGFRRNKVVDLSPLAGMPLERLDCAENSIRSLKPLAGMAIQALYCQGNPLESLEPFVSAPPPPEFYYFDPRLPRTEIVRAVAAWERRHGCEMHVHLGRVALAMLDRNPGELRRLAVRRNGHAYLLIPVVMPFERADSLCRALGGHLLTLTSSEEAAFVLSICPPQWLWLGLVDGAEDDVRWCTGEPPGYLALSMAGAKRGDRFAYGRQTGLTRFLPYAEAHPVVEWEE